MPKFHVDKTFQFGGDIRQAGSILTISKADLEKEIARGRKDVKQPDGSVKQTGKWLSGLLNHCSPEDDGAAATVAETVAEDEPGDEEAARIATIRAEMDEMGAAWDRRWKLPKLENELVKAKKVRGL